MTNVLPPVPSSTQLRAMLEEMVLSDLLGPVGGPEEEIDEQSVGRYLVVVRQERVRRPPCRKGPPGWPGRRTNRRRLQKFGPKASVVAEDHGDPAETLTSSLPRPVPTNGIGTMTRLSVSTLVRSMGRVACRGNGFTRGREPRHGLTTVVTGHGLATRWRSARTLGGVKFLAISKRPQSCVRLQGRWGCGIGLRLVRSFGPPPKEGLSCPHRPSPWQASRSRISGESNRSNWTSMDRTAIQTNSLCWPVRTGAARPPCSKRDFSRLVGPRAPNWSQARLVGGRFVTDRSFTGSEPKSRSTAKKAKSSLQARCPNHFRCMKSGRFGTFLPGERQRLSVR